MEGSDLRMSLATLRFFEELLGQVSLQASHPAFEQIAAQIVTAREELAEAIERTTAIEAIETAESA